MKDLKIKVNNEAESKEVQELLFELGYRDRKNWTQRNPEHDSIQAWLDGEFTFSLNHNQVPVRFKETTIAELRSMVKPMKEYLMPSRNYEYILTDAREALEPHARDWISIPEGAEVAMLYKTGDVEFFKEGYDYFWLDKFQEWKSTKSTPKFHKTASIAWVRPTQPEALPFIDDNPQSLNEQYAEIEQVRQSLKDNVNHPSHYTQGKVECLDALESATIGKSGIEAVCVANIIKYLWRYEEKNGLEDIKKANFYLNRLIATLENNNG